MSRSGTVARAVFALALFAGRLSAQQHVHPPSASEKVGSVHFATSCAPSVEPEFDHAVALLHSFEFGAAIRGFTRVLETDSTCAMARWGIALSRWGNPMTAGNRSQSVLEVGHQAAKAAMQIADRATDRERGYIAAVSQLYADYEHTTQRARVVAYETAMADLVAKQPADTEAKIFHALALAAAAPPTDKTYANQREAGAVLEQLWARQPSHPGLAHYIIHSYDVPALADRARIAAARYADLAPSAAHALHMPSHTFTRVGMWSESVRTNLRSIEVANGQGAFGEVLHASDYAVYAYLQMRNDSAASALIATLPARGKELDARATAGAANTAAGVFARAAMPARYALERRDWVAAAALQPHASASPYTEAMTYFARALGASHTGNLVDARASIDSLAVIRERLRVAGEAYWVEQVAIEHLGASAWLHLAERRDSVAVATMREAATREDATEKSAVTPGPLAPAHELLADMLMQLGRSREALQEYQVSLAKEPNRFRTLYGAMRAAAAAGDRATEARYAEQLEQLTGSASYSR